MHLRITSEIDLIAYNNTSHIQFILCFITKGIRSHTVEMSSPQQNVLIHQKNQKLV